jgi:hypothetical protein
MLEPVAGADMKLPESQDVAMRFNCASSRLHCVISSMRWQSRTTQKPLGLPNAAMSGEHGMLQFNRSQQQQAKRRPVSDRGTIASGGVRVNTNDNTCMVAANMG